MEIMYRKKRLEKKSKNKNDTILNKKKTESIRPSK